MGLNDFIESKIVSGTFKEQMFNDTVKYQKRYGFEIGAGTHATWNNEADAFKHAYMQAYLFLLCGGNKAKFLGNSHENYGYAKQGQTPAEEHMDKWNNAQGRDIGKEVFFEYGMGALNVFNPKVQDLIAQKVAERMQAGRLILSPDGRKIPNKSLNLGTKNTKKFSSGKIVTGHAADIIDNLSDLLTPANRVFYDGEINPAKTKQDEFVEPLLEQFYDNGRKLPTESELQSRVRTGELIYVKDYIRSNGVKVSGYYRHYPED